MGVVEIGLILLLVLLLLLGSGLWVALSLMGVALVGIELFSGAPTGLAISNSLFRSISSWSLAALPMFILMGEILFRSRLSEDMYAGLSPWLNRLPGVRLPPLGGCRKRWIY